MKKALLAAALTGVISIAPAVHAYELDSEHKKLSYSLGLLIGSKLKADVDNLDTQAFHAALKDVYQGADPQLDQAQVAEVMQAFQVRKMEEQRQLIAEQADKNLKEGQAYMAENAKQKGVKTTDSGLQYQILTEGKGKHPGASDVVKVHYKGELIDGTEFDSSYRAGEPITFPLNGVIPGWTEGLQLMKEGGKARLVIPPELAYGPGGMGNAIGPNQTLIFEVELLEVNPKEDTASAE